MNATAGGLLAPARRVGQSESRSVDLEGDLDGHLPTIDATVVVDVRTNVRNLRPGLAVDIVGGGAEGFDDGCFDALGRFLGLAGLAALLLGMVGVASAMHVWVGRRLAGAAVLRCLGATGGTVVRIGIGEAAILAAAGSVVGIVLGVGLQAALPRLVGDLLPVDFRFAPDPRGALVGLAIGIWTATLFATRAILPLRHVPALGAIRRAALGSAEGAGGVRAPERLVDLALAATVTGLCVWQADRLGRGLGFAATLGAVLVVLHLLSGGLMRAARGARGARVPYAVRQGIANLFRPRNQTRAAVAGLGLGVFLMATVAVVERNLRARLSIDPQAANFALYDVPAAAAAEVSALLRAGGHPVLGVIPILPARIAAVKGVPATDLLDRSARRGVRGAPAGPPVGAWALRREYRNSVRDTLVESERLVAGTWWSGPRPPGVRVSLETEVARALNVGVGDTVTWDVQGRRVESEIASLREVEWARLEPNFVALFEPGSVEDLPASELVLTRIDDPGARATFIRQATERWPAVLLIDLTAIRATLEEVLGRAALVVRVLGGFLLLAGLLVVVSTTAAARGARSRESSLLRALGAGTFTLHGILAVEFFAIGAMAALAGIGSAAAAGWGLARWVLGIPYRVPVADLAWLALGVAALTLLVGALGSRAVVRVSALEAIRRAESAG